MSDGIKHFIYIGLWLFTNPCELFHLPAIAAANSAHLFDQAKKPPDNQTVEISEKLVKFIYLLLKL